MAVFPTTLPAPMLDSLTESPPTNIIRSSMDVGPAKKRRRTTANTRPLSFTIMLTPAQVAILDSFYVNDAASGANNFDYTHPRTGAGCTAGFTSPPQYGEKEGVCYSTIIALEIFP